MKLAHIQRTLPLLLTLFCLLLPSAASANAAMSLALTIFPWNIWFVYVIVTVIFEAVALGRWLKVPFLHALPTSIGANLLTATIGVLFAVPIWGLLGSYGNLLNPNPFGHTLFLFTVFGIGSSLLEAYMWMRPAGIHRTTETISDAGTITSRGVFRRCIAVHLIGVPLGLAILLIPSHPYPGLQGQVGYARYVRVGEKSVTGALDGYLGDHHKYPLASTYEQALQLLMPYMGDWAHNPNLWTVAYVADYHRFDTGETKRRPIEWNSAISKVTENDVRTAPIWITRDRYYYPYGIVLMPDGEIRRSYNSADLGYKPANAIH